MQRSIPAFVVATAIAALLCIGVVTTLFPFNLSLDWALPFGVLLLVAVTGTTLSVRITAGGSTSSINFLLELGAIPLLGPAGAVALAVLSMLISELVVRKKPFVKMLFNTSQSALSVGVAAIAYSQFAPPPDLNSIDLASVIIPFIGAGILYFGVNSSLVGTAITLESGKSFTEVWHDVTGPTLFVDIVLTPIALSVPLLYIHWGPLGLLLTIIPIIGLRYSYGLNIELRNLNRDLLRVLVKTLEAQDPYTSGHSVRVSENARAISRELGLRRQHIHNIETAALLHDIGKVGQDYSEILRQEGALSDKQRRLIKKHPERGADIVRPVRSLDPSVVQAIRHHHERYDGDGYPDGLAGDDIPIGARVIMVADTIDAMATDRPYRQSMSTDEISEELKQYSGEQFDPEVVNAALSARILEKEPYKSGQPTS